MMTIDTIRARIKEIFGRLTSRQDVRQAVGTEPPDLGAMADAIALWGEMFADRAPWISDTVQSCGLPAAISGELARLTVTGLETTIDGSGRAEYIGQQFARFRRRLRSAVDQGCAAGTLILKPYVDGGNIVVDCVPAWRFVPVGYNSTGEITGAIFPEYTVRGGYYYTRLELHQMTDGDYVVRNLAYRSASKDTLGTPCGLDAVDEWASLEEETHFGLTGGAMDRPLFATFRVPWANNLEPSSPLGVSVYGRAVNLIRNADEHWSRILWEYEGSELAVDASEGAIPPGGGMPRGKRRLFRSLRLDSGDKDLYSVFSPQIRDGSLFNGLNQMLRRIEFNCNLAYGTLSDPQNVDKTAEEIRASKQRSFTAVAELQEALQAALEHLVWIMDYYATVYKLAPAGKSVLHCTWGDGVKEDVDVEYQRRKAMVDAGYLRPEALLSWYFGVSEEDAAKMLPQTDGIRFEGL